MLHVLVAAAVLLSLIAGLLLLRGKSPGAERAQPATHSKEDTDSAPSAPKGGAPAAGGRKAAAPSRRKQEADAERAIRAHPLFRSALKGHAKAISDVAASADGKAVATASEDRTVRVYVAATIAQPTAEHQFVVCKMDLDDAVGIAFLPSGRTLACAMRDSRRVDVVALPPSRRERPRIKQSFPANGHSATLRGIVAAPPAHDAQTGATVGTALLLTHAGPPDTGVRAWTPRGDPAASVRTNLVENNAVAARPDGRLVAAAGFASDLRLLAVERQKGSGECRALRPVSSLQGHKHGAADVAFADGGVLVVAGKDGTVSLWDTNVRLDYEEPCRCTASLRVPGRDKGALLSESKVAVTADARVVIVAVGSTVHFSDAREGRALATVEQAHLGAVSHLCVVPSERLLITSAHGERYAHVWAIPEPK